MSKQYGIPYQGSKNSIAEELIRKLPSGNRFVDLFGGGFAMSHVALISGKYNAVLYSELNELLPPLIKKAILGEYDYKNFKPKWVSREDFQNLKEKDGYIKYIWSFSNSGRQYMFGKDLEPRKKSIHNWVVFNEKDEWFKKYFYDIDKYIKTEDIKARRILWKKYIDMLKVKGDANRLQQLERLERLQNLQQLQQLERLQNLAIVKGDYKDYKYMSGDVVYLDPPYYGTADYGDVFDFQEFFDWVDSRPYPVYFTMYNNMPDERFKMLWAISKRLLMSGASKTKNYECLFGNKMAHI